MSEYKKIGNRYYKTELSEGGISMVTKATYDSEENVYHECGRWVASEFAELPDASLDGNTKIEKSKIVSELKLPNTKVVGEYV